VILTFSKEGIKVDMSFTGGVHSFGAKSVTLSKVMHLHTQPVTGHSA